MTTVTIDSKTEKLIASVEKAEEKVSKIEKTIERHFTQVDKKIAKLEKVGITIDYSKLDFEVNYSEFKAQLEGFEKLTVNADGENVAEWWEIWEVTRKLDDIRSSKRKLIDARQTLANWKERLYNQQVKESFINNEAPQVVIDFVNSWGEMAFEWHMKNDKRPDEDSIRRFIENEKQVKIFDLTYRVMKVTGKIQDARGLEVSGQGTINGIVKGENGSARVETIMAGGWNIQCWHYRTIVVKL